MLFKPYPQLNVWLARVFGVAMARLAGDLRHFCLRSGVNGYQFTVAQRVIENAARMATSQLHCFQYATTIGNCTQRRLTQLDISRHGSPAILEATPSVSESLFPDSGLHCREAEIAT
jgi:hypothetical protein